MESLGPRKRRQSYEWLSHACAIALVLMGHIGLLMVMLRPATPRYEKTAAVTPSKRDTVQVRFLHRTQVKPSTSIAEHRSITASHAALPVHRAKRFVEKSNNIVTAPLSPSETPLVLTPAVSASNTGTYVAGGNSFLQNLEASDHPFEDRVPGGYQPRAPRFKMTDPRYQGAAWVARFVQHYILHAVDSHCVDVNTWLGMSPEEQAKHASLSEIKQIAEEYGCLEPERFPDTTH
jgi:hypothetical protein